VLVSDPPYGIGWRTPRGRARPKGDWSVIGDDQPFDPTHLLALGLPSVLFGANHYADRLPASAGWIVWDKRYGMPSNDQSDAELAWTNILTAVRTVRCLWNGGGSLLAENGPSRAIHPTQKPVRLMRAVLEMVSLYGQIVLDPYLGTGTTLVAAQSLGRRAIGIEIEEKYCQIAVDRLRQMPLPLTIPMGHDRLSASTQGGLFDGSPANGRDQTENIRGQQGAPSIGGTEAAAKRDAQTTFQRGEARNPVGRHQGADDVEPEGRGIHVLEGRKAN